MWNCTFCENNFEIGMSFRCLACHETDAICFEDRPLFFMQANNNVYKCRLCTRFSIPYSFCKLSAFNNMPGNLRRNSDGRQFQASNFPSVQVYEPRFSGSPMEDVMPCFDQGFNHQANYRFDARNDFNQILQSAPVINNFDYYRNVNRNEEQIKVQENNAQAWNFPKPDEYSGQPNNFPHSFQRPANQHRFSPFQASRTDLRNFGSGVSSFHQPNSNLVNTNAFPRQNEGMAEEMNPMEVEMFEDFEEKENELLCQDFKVEVLPEDLTLFEEDRGDSQKVEEQVGQFRANNNNNNNTKSIFEQVDKSKKSKKKFE